MPVNREPWFPPIRSLAYVWETISLRDGDRERRVEDLCDQSLHRRTLTYPFDDIDPNPPGTGALHETATVGQGITQEFGHSYEMLFQLSVDGSFAGDRLSLRRPGWYESRFTFNVTCPVGYDQFQWYLTGTSNVNRNTARRYVRFAVGRIREPTSHNNWSQFFDDQREYRPGDNAYFRFPEHWSAEATEQTFPIAPGQTVRSFFDFRIFDWGSEDNRWNGNIAAYFGMVFLDGNNPRRARILGDKTGVVQPIVDPFIKMRERSKFD